ncbi:MAG: hypothetical protein ABSE35_17060 [Bryobacteraceae bacterium]|jgi:hypothetical protein
MSWARLSDLLYPGVIIVTAALAAVYLPAGAQIRRVVLWWIEGDGQQESFAPEGDR